MPCVVFVHGLEVVCSQHKNNKVKWRVDLDSLGQTDKTVPSGFEWIIPYRAATVEAILYDANLLTRGTKRQFHHARPALIKKQALACRRNDAPRQGIGVDNNVLH